MTHKVIKFKKVQRVAWTKLVYVLTRLTNVSLAINTMHQHTPSLDSFPARPEVKI